jgi:hypothetical protein
MHILQVFDNSFSIIPSLSTVQYGNIQRAKYVTVIISVLFNQN